MKTPTKILIAVLSVAVLAVGGFLVWFYVIKEDAPPAFDEGSLDEALGTVPVAFDGDIDGTWTIADGSQVGYRVKEVLAGLDTEGAGRTDDITGTVTIDGTTVTAAQFTVDMTTFASDDGRRDNQFNGRIMEVSRFPTATFVLTGPIELGAQPAEGELVTVPATGDLTLHGVTRSVTFELQTKLDGGQIGIVGSTVIVFADYDIENPSNGFATTGDDGTLELQLVLRSA